jgi:hypothetical protein
MMSLAVFSMWLRRACGNELHPAGQTLDTYGLLISGRKWKSCHMTKRLRPVRLWNQLSGNGQMGPGPMTSPKEVCPSRPFLRSGTCSSNCGRVTGTQREYGSARLVPVNDRSSSGLPRSGNEGMHRSVWSGSFDRGCLTEAALFAPRALWDFHRLRSGSY